MSSTKHQVDFSQYGQPAFIRHFIPDEVPRWVVDVGAHDGLDGSNSRGFILDSFTALLIEPLPSVFEKLKANSQGFDNVRLEQCACAEFEGEATFHIGRDGADGQTSSLCEDEFWTNNHSGEDITVRVRTLTGLLAAHACPPEFSVLLVDAEGMDLEVLSGLDFSRFRPAVICTEVYEVNPEKDRRKADLLEQNGYRCMGRVGSDTIWSCKHLVAEPLIGLASGSNLPPEIAALSVTGNGVVAFDPLTCAGGILTISGWAFAPDQTVPELLFVAIKTENRLEWKPSERRIRSDVGRHFGNPALDYSGFRAKFPSKLVTTADVSLVQVQNNSRWDNHCTSEVFERWQ